MIQVNDLQSDCGLYSANLARLTVSGSNVRITLNNGVNGAATKTRFVLTGKLDTKGSSFTITAARGNKMTDRIRGRRTGSGRLTGRSTTAGINPSGETGWNCANVAVTLVDLSFAGKSLATARCEENVFAALVGRLGEATVGKAQCSGRWAVGDALVVHGGQADDVTVVFKWSARHWRIVGRGNACARHEIPSAIYRRACESN